MTEDDDHQRAKKLFDTARSEPSTVDIEALLSLVESASEPARWNAAGALGYAGSSHAGHIQSIVEHLQSLLDDDSDRVRARAVGSLGQIAEEHPAAIRAVVDDVRAAYDDVVKVRRRVVHTLGYACRETPVEVRQNVEYLCRASQDDDEIVRRHAEDGLDRLTSTPPEEVLWTQITDETEPQSVRERCVDALVSRAMVDPHNVRAAVDSATLSVLLTDAFPNLREQIAALLRELAADSSVRFASTDFDPDDKSTRGPSDRLLDALEAALTDPNPEVRAHVTEIFRLLVNDGSTPAAPVVSRFDQLQARIGDDVPTVREHATAIAATLAVEESSVVAPVRDLLRERLTDAEPAVRERAAAALMPLALAAGDIAAVVTVSHDAGRHVSVGLARGFASVAETAPHIAQVGVDAVLPLVDTAPPEARIRLLNGYEHVVATASEAVVSTVPLLESALTDADTGVRHAAARTLTIVLASHPEVSDRSIADLLTGSQDIRVDTVRAGTGSTPRGQPSHSAVVDPVWMLWTLLQEPIAQDAHSRTTELTAQIPTDWASDNTVPATVRQQIMKELARIARDRPAAMTDAADTESIDYLLGTLLGDNDDRVAMHALRVHKRLSEADELAPPPGDDAGQLSIYLARSEVELQSMLTDAYPGLRADAAEVLAERLALQKYGELDHEEVAKLIPHLQLCLAAPDDGVRVAAAEALRRIPSSFVFRPADQSGMVLTTHPDIESTETYELDTERFVAALTDDLSVVREVVAELLTQLLSPTELRAAGVTAETAMDLLDADSVSEQQRGVELLEQLAVDSPEVVRPAVDALVAWLDETGVDARPAASALLLIAREYPDAVNLSNVANLSTGSLHVTMPRNLGARIGRTEISEDAVQRVVEQLQPLMTAGAESTAVEGDPKYFALGTIRGLARHHPTGIKPAVGTLETHLTGTGSHRERAAGALTHYYVAAGQEASLRRIFDDDDQAVRKQAIDAMKPARPTPEREAPADVAAVLEAIEPLLVPPDVNTEADRRIRQAAVETVQCVAAETPQAAVPLLEPLSQIRDADTEVQSAVEQAISRIETANHELSDFME